jgi:hypothetical protein
MATRRFAITDHGPGISISEVEVDPESDFDFDLERERLSRHRDRVLAILDADELEELRGKIDRALGLTSANLERVW